jgi:hypothetical protein
MALEKQVGTLDREIIVVCDGRIKDVQRLRERFAFVRFHQVSGHFTQEALRATGARLAQGRIVALTVDHCTPEEHWCERMVTAHADPFAAVGGAIEKGVQPDTAANWAIHFYDYCNYGYYLNPVMRGLSHNLSDCNVSYKREALAKTADFWAEEFHVPLVNQALLARGERLWLSPDIVVCQHRDIRLARAVQVAYRRGRRFSSTRIVGSNLGRQLVYIASSPLLPLLLLGRLIKNVSQKRSHVGLVLRVFPLIVLLATVWSWGEFMGYLTRQPPAVLDLD